MSAYQDRNKSGLAFRTRSRCSEGKVFADARSFEVAVAEEARRIVMEAAAGPAGETIKGQIRRACRAPGYRDGHWRVRSAWKGEAGSWSAKAFAELQTKHSAWKAKQERLADAEAKTAATFLQFVANKFDGSEDAGLDRQTIDRLRALADRLGR